MNGRASASSILVRAPATAGNFAGAQHGAALALDASMNVKINSRLDGQVRIRYFGEDGDRVPRDSSNLIVQAMRAALVTGHAEGVGADLEIYNSIPVGVGLGASAAAVWSGLIASNALFELQLDEKALFALASTLESRQENLHAAWFGGLAVLAAPGGEFCAAPIPESFELAIVIPLATARPFQDPNRPAGNVDKAHAMRQAAHVARFFAHGACDGSLRIETVVPDPLDQAVPGLREALNTPAVLGSFVCGEGPAVGVLSRDKSGIDSVLLCLSRHGIPARVVECRPSASGARDWNAINPFPAAVEIKPFAAGVAAGLS